MEYLKHRIKYVHIKDARMSDGTVVPPGKGDGNYNIILPEYITMGGTCFTMEPHLAEFVGLQGLEREGEESNVGKYHLAAMKRHLILPAIHLKNYLKIL